RVQHTVELRVDELDVAIEVERAPIPLRIAEAHPAEHRRVDEERLFAVHEHRPARIARLRDLPAGLETLIELLARARIARALIDLLQRVDLRGREALARAARLALQHARVEPARARVGQDAVLHAVVRVA